MRTLAPGTATAVEILRSKGFTVEWRINANGSPRLKVGRERCLHCPRAPVDAPCESCRARDALTTREMSAADLSRRFAAYL